MSTHVRRGLPNAGTGEQIECQATPLLPVTSGGAGGERMGVSMGPRDRFATACGRHAESRRRPDEVSHLSADVSYIWVPVGFA